MAYKWIFHSKFYFLSKLLGHLIMPFSKQQSSVFILTLLQGFSRAQESTREVRRNTNPKQNVKSKSPLCKKASIKHAIFDPSLLFLTLQTLPAYPITMWMPHLSCPSGLVSSQDWVLGPFNFIKKRPWHRCFPLNFEKYLRKPIFVEHLRTTTSEICLHQIKNVAIARYQFKIFAKPQSLAEVRLHCFSL